MGLYAQEWQDPTRFMKTILAAHQRTIRISVQEERTVGQGDFCRGQTRWDQESRQMKKKWLITEEILGIENTDVWMLLFNQKGR